MSFASQAGISSARTFVLRILAACALGALCMMGLSSCSHEPEIATPPADYGQEDAADASQNTADNQADDASADAQADEQTSDQAAEETDAAESEEAEETPAHVGPYVISILNAGGADGLAAAAQESLAASDIQGDDYQITLDSYLGGIVPTTTVYVSGEGDDAEAVRAEADKVAKALGGEVKTFKAGELIDGVTMDGLDMLVLVGSDAL